MKSQIFFVFICFLLYCSCSKPAAEPEVTDSAVAGTGMVVIKEYHSNGKVKTEIAAVGQLRNGPTRNYDREGRLLSEVNYIDNVKEGLATNYYANTGKVNSTLEFKNGIKEGNEIWYYESGKEYRISPFVTGKIEGVQKLFYENGQLMAEIPYKEGFPGEGLKEYNKDGSVIKGYPRLMVRQKDHLADANKVLLVISVSDESTDVKFYKGNLGEGKFINAKLLLLATQGGKTQIDFNIPPGSMLNQTVVISAVIKTRFGNPYVSHKTVNLSIMNPK